MIWVYVEVQLISLAITALLLLSSYLDRSRVSRIDRLMNALLWLNFAKTLCRAAMLLLDGNAAFSVLHALFCCASLALGFPMVFIFTLYIQAYIQDGSRAPGLLVKLCHALSIAGFLLCIVSLFTPIVFSAQGGLYTRAPQFFLAPLIAAAALIVDVLVVLLCRPPLARRMQLSLISHTVLPLLACIAQIFLPPRLDIVNIGITLALLVIYILVHVDRGHQLALQEKQMVESRVSVMLSQIQPHFLYNALLVIQDLCHDKAPEAEAAAIEFSRFLRGNIDSLNADKPIPFQKEAEHTRNYLALEKRRFGDRLNIEWDIRATDFTIPALSLQPIVENAVHYGVTRCVEGGTVKILSFETDAEYIVTVIDNGIGYDPEQTHDDGRTHIGIGNVRERLRTMCGGKLTINSQQGIGTAAVITIPKGDAS